MWDAKAALDHSVRTVAQCRQVAETDLAAAVGLLDLRVISPATRSRRDDPGGHRQGLALRSADPAAPARRGRWPRGTPGTGSWPIWSSPT